MLLPVADSAHDFPLTCCSTHSCLFSAAFQSLEFSLHLFGICSIWKNSGTPPECLITFALKAMPSDALAAHSGHLELRAWPPCSVSITPDRMQQLNLDLHHVFPPLVSQSHILPPAPGRFSKVQTQVIVACIADDIKTKNKTDSSLCTL